MAGKAVNIMVYSPLKLHGDWKPATRH